MVLCDLEGRTHEQAARHLGWPVGTVKSRLSRGRERLRDRLLRRGLAPDAGLIASALDLDGPLASLSSALVDSTVDAATRFLAVRTHRPRVRRVTSPGSSPIHVHHPMVESRLGPARRRRDGPGVGLLAQKGTRVAQAQARGESPGGQARREGRDLRGRSPAELSVRRDRARQPRAVHVSDMYCKVEGQNDDHPIVARGRQGQEGRARLRARLGGPEEISSSTRGSTAKSKPRPITRTPSSPARSPRSPSRNTNEGISKPELETLKEEITAAQSAIHKAKGRLERTRLARKRLDDALGRTKGASTTADIVAELDVDDRLEAAEQTLLTARRWSLESGRGPSRSSSRSTPARRRSRA